MNTDSSPFNHIDFSDEDKAAFYHTLRQAAFDFGCNYISYVYELPAEGLRVGFTSNPDWQHQYIDDKMINHCHLWQTVRSYFDKTHQSAFILPWDTVKPNDSLQKEMILYREEMDVGRNGISFCTQTTGMREFLAFAPSRSENNFTHHLANNMDTIREIAKSFRSASQRRLTLEKEEKEIVEYA